jgi:hypothetical protein
MWQSGPWKLELGRLIRRCEDTYVQMSRMREQTWWEDAVQTMQMEKAVFLSAFITRKLVDSERLSMQVEATTLRVEAFLARDPDIAPRPDNWENLDRFYDLDKGHARDVQMRQLVNWIIHSFAFIVEVRSDHASGHVPVAFWCNSDRTRVKEILRVPWVEYKRLLTAVQEDDVVEMQTLRDGKGGHRQLRSNAPLTPQQRENFWRTGTF